MSQPAPYTVTVSFAEEELNAVTGRSSLRTAALDTELANVATSISELISNLSVIQRDDTGLNDGIVTPSSLSPATLLLLGSAGFTVSDPIGWLTGTLYAAQTIVTQGTGTYISVVAHTSGTFATDLAAGKWVVIFDTVNLTAASVTNTPSGDIASTTVQAALNELDTDKIAKATLTAEGSILIASSGATPADFPVGSDYRILRARAAATNGLEWVDQGGSRVLGCDCVNNSGTPNTKFDLDALEIHLRDATGSSVTRINPGAAITNDVGLLGPAANGRDQVGAFSASSWIYIYWIWNGTDLATISSTVPPPVGPTLPTGYTHWCYAGAVRFDGSSHLLKTYFKGSWAYYATPVSILATGVSTSEVSLATPLVAAVPASAAAYRLFALLTGSYSVSGDGADSALLKLVTGVNFISTLTQFSEATLAEPRYSSCEMTFPNTQTLIYQISRGSTGGTGPTLTMGCIAYQNANGGE